MDEVRHVPPAPAEEEQQEQGEEVASGQRLLVGHRPEHAPPDGAHDDHEERGADSSVWRAEERCLESLQAVGVVGQGVMVGQDWFEAVKAAPLAAIAAARAFGGGALFAAVVLDFDIAVLLLGGAHGGDGTQGWVVTDKTWSWCGRGSVCVCFLGGCKCNKETTDCSIDR